MVIFEPKNVKEMEREMARDSKKLEDISSKDREIFKLTMQKFNQTTENRLEQTVSFV